MPHFWENAYICSRAANDPTVFTITEKAPTMAFSWLKVPTCSVGAFNQEKAVVGAFSVIVKTVGSFAAQTPDFYPIMKCTTIARVKERRGRIKRDYFVNWTKGF